MKALYNFLLYVPLLLALLHSTPLTAQLPQRLWKPLGWPPKASLYEPLPYFREGDFQNPVETPMLGPRESLPLLFRQLTNTAEKVPNPYYRFSEQALPAADTAQLQLNWLGHAAVLIKSADTYLLTDPMLVGRASPFSFIGPKRFFPSPITPEALPQLDGVIISHDHYDHLSYESLKAIQHKVKHFFVPLGVGASLRYWGIPDEKIVEMAWWQTYEGEAFSLTATPARHFSGRVFDNNNTLWASWAIEINGQKIYFGGDSGFFEGYEEIGQKLGPFDVALMPIGAYEKAWQAIHLNPEEAVEAQKLVHGKLLLPIHWGTFDLALHSWYEPMVRLIAEAEKQHVPLLTPEPGQWITIYTPTNALWWQQYRRSDPNK